MNALELLVAAAIIVGLVGVVVPVLPGSLLVLAALLVWAAAAGNGVTWVLFALGAIAIAAATAIKYVVPHRRLSEAGVPRSTLVLGGLLGIVGFFVIPVVGLVVGFIAGVYLAELGRVGGSAAWRSTWAALGAAGLSMLIELAGALFAAAAFVVGVIVT